MSIKLSEQNIRREDWQSLEPSVEGWGINDVNYKVYKTEVVNGERENVWTCPYYVKWTNILKRCFSLGLQERLPIYKGCTVTEDWKYLSNFITWVDSQPNKDWENCDTDKDFLIKGNKHYSPDTVVFVSSRVNSFIVDSGNVRGDYMIGVCYIPHKSKKNPYQAQCKNPFGNNRYIGIYPTELEAHLAWKSRKHELACQLADLQSDERIAKILRERYAPDKDWTKV